LHAPSSTETAIANGDTRTLTFINKHTNEAGSFTYLVNGVYDQAALDKLNWFMRDWRLNEQTKMDPHLFDIIWEVYRQSGSAEPIDVLSGYRSPQTNAMLRRRSRLVSSHSQHMQGKAIDAHFLDVGPGKIRDVAMLMQEGGVGFYPIGSTPWIHIDSGAVRYWPRMSRSALARLFPDGKTVFIPADGQPMERYAEAKAMIEQRGGEIQTASSSGGLLSWLFGGARGGGADDEEESAAGPIISGGRGGAPVMVSARGAPAPAMVAAAAPAAPAATPTETSAAADSGDAQPPSSADDGEAAVAPVPPARPIELLAALDAPPVPPKRPPELSIPASPSDAASLRRDLIAAMIERQGLPSAITQGTHGPPRDALALADPGGRSGQGDPDALARAAALAPPPLPPRRPRADGEGVSTAEKAPPVPPPRPARPSRSSAANPFGSLVVDAFNVPSPSAVPTPVPDLRGPSF
jgi:uncharacterized protein YcbK (DUF882 family)